MAVGMITIIALLVIRIQAYSPFPALPAGIELPEGAEPAAITAGAGWFAVVVQDGGESLILLFDDDGTPLEQIPIENLPAD